MPRFRRLLSTAAGRCGRALTLVELLTALSITVFIGAVLAVLINSTAMGTNSQNDGRRSLVKMQAIKAQVEDLIMNARCVLAVDSNYIVLWNGDSSGAATPPNGAVNYLEILMLEVDPATGNITLWTPEFPANWDNAQVRSYNYTFAASSDWYGACTYAKTTTYFVPQTLGTNATGMTVSLDSPLCRTAKMVSIVISFNDESQMNRKLLIGAGIENQGAPW